MGKLIETWKKSSMFERIAIVITIFLACVVVILSALGLVNIISISTTNSIVIPLTGIITLLNGLMSYKKNKLTGTIVLVCAGVIIICCISIFLMRFLA